MSTRTSSQAREREEILALIAEERAAVERGDAAQYLSVLADDALFMPPGLAPRGGAELRAWLSDFVSSVRVEWLDFQSHDVEVRGDLGYHTYAYTWRVTPRAGGNASTSGGKGLHILRRQSDGSWKIAREIWNAGS